MFLLWAGPVVADDWSALDQPGAIAIMRHALAPGTGDPSAFRLEACATQRNLDDRGRAQARTIGRALRDRGVAFDHVLTSQWCRTRETAALLDLGTPVDAPSLNSFFQDFSTREAQTEATRALLQSLSGRVMLVTHQVNISALTGVGTRSGEIVVFRLTDPGVEVLGRILIDP
jgi:phosphohistidine phosphatase SixA